MRVGDGVWVVLRKVVVWLYLTVVGPENAWMGSMIDEDVVYVVGVVTVYAGDVWQGYGMGAG